MHGNEACHHVHKEHSGAEDGSTGEINAKEVYVTFDNEIVDGEEVIEEEDVEKLGHDNQDLASSSPSSSTISVTRHVDILRLLLNSVPLFCEWI